MPAKYEMGWDASHRRWTKMVKGHRLTVSCRQLSEWSGKRVPETKEGSYQVANRWLAWKRQEIEGGVIDQPEVIEARRRAAWCRQNGQEEDAKVWAELARKPYLWKGVQAGLALHTWGNTGVNLEDVKPTRELIEHLAGGAVWKERLGESDSDDVMTVGKARSEWLEIRRLGRIKGNTYSNSVNTSSVFADHLGNENPITIINEEVWERWLVFLVKQDGWTDGYKNVLIRTAKQFISWCVSRKLIQSPANLSSRHLVIPPSPVKIKTVPIEDCRRLMTDLPANMRCVALLCLNCLFTQVDCSDLLDSEVDWQNGRIIRKRTKTAANPRTPLVDYLLWEETFSALKAERSGKDRVLLTKAGEVWIVGRTDKLAHQWARDTAKIGLTHTIKLLRKTSATLLGNHPEFGVYAQHLLGHAPTSTATTHYIKPDQDRLDAALIWLRSQYIS